MSRQIIQTLKKILGDLNSPRVTFSTISVLRCDSVSLETGTVLWRRVRAEGHAVMWPRQESQWKVFCRFGDRVGGAA